ncbi:pullulanase-type alpha-1,6-glucosidase [Lentzea tibetensis]|uniref:1,4-alpha-D-glucan glucanohydrolase n=1 Tax=Lentzea tibetensis TaxID=2591470 RepID=A0A563EL37_9PSEU|nr:pullulanase-type alpha-1,6-glucosidase [Lentzea tibetensis]TWP47450.1 pullulanase-type alpha-1,6-glucosidase [Lentzea tibetensis]
MRRVVAALAAFVLVPFTPLAHAAPAKERLAVGEVVDIAPGVRDGDSRLAKDAVRTDLAGERFYFVMPDRFANGDPRNDRGGSRETDRLKHGFDPTDKGFYHGGDLKGLQGKLDYLDGMGITAIWMTPMFQNQWVQGSGADASAAYHGYWTTDFTKLDPHFGTTREMRDLIRDAHQRGMKVFFDIVANHTADVISYTEGRTGYVSTGAQPYLDASGKPFDIGEHAGRADFPKLDAKTSFPYTPVRSGPTKHPLWLNDVTLYHNRGDSTFSGESSEQGDFSGLDDLMTEHPRVVNGMKDIFTSWIDTLDIDGYRVDTVKHVNVEFWQALAPHVKEYARKKGKKDFFVFGEVFDGNPENTSKYTTTGRMQATLDFPFQGAAAGFLSGKGSARLGEVLVDDDRYTDADSNASSLPTFLGNHDMGRIAWMIRQNKPGISDDELLARLKLGNSLMYLWRGNPVVYYGDEQGFAGGGGDKLARQDLFASRTPEYAGEKLIGSDRTGAVDNFNTDHPLYRQLQDLAKFVDTDSVWRKGNQVLRYSDGDVVAFSRMGEREHLVVANAGTTKATVSVPVSSAKFDGGHQASNGKVTVEVPPLSTLVLKGSAPIPTIAPAPVLVAPAQGTVLDKRVELRADGIGAANAQATFAARVEGGSEWTVLGTDDSAPYRVFADLASLPGAKAGKRVELRVVARSGAIGADGAFVTLVPAPPVQPPGTKSPDWLVVHYQRDNYDGWGLHVWGDAETPTEWSQPLPFAGETPYGRFAWVKLKPGAKQVGIIAHKGDEKDTAIDRFVDPSVTPEVWLEQGQEPVHPSEQAATGKATVHYAGDATNVAVRVPGRADAPFTGTDSFGAYADLPPTTDFSLVRGGNIVASGKFTSASAWVKDDRVHASRAAAENRAVIHYFRPDGDYTDWTMYHWTGSLEPSPGWNQSRQPDGRDAFGAYWSVPLAPGAPGLSYIVHRGDAKDPGVDQFLTLAEKGNEVWQLSGNEKYLLPPSSGPAADDDLTKSKAIWVAKDLVVWDVPVIASDGYRIEYGGRVLRLVPSTSPVPDRFPHLRGKPVFQVRGYADGALREKLAAVHTDSSGAIRHRTGVQIAGVLDDRYAAAATKLTYGPSFDHGRASVRLWAPTARTVKLRLFDKPSGEPVKVVELKRDDASGSWSASGNWKDEYYQFEVTNWQRSIVVTDPYSVALAVNSTHSQFADLGDGRTMPGGWSGDVARGIGGAITELHVRDFSINDQSVPAGERGTYKAFTHKDSVGMRHLAELAKAGMDTVHLLPTFDIATIPEKRSDQATPACDLPSLPADSEQQQACVGAVAAKDGFNWGYDPFHYDVPEGSYAVAQDGWARSREYREMVKSLHDNGNRVVVDVVYNHTAAHGDAPTSVLDKVVPGYYQRLNLDGSVANSTCCSNTATENAMMGKLVVDSVVRWARTYKVDGFRFDLMGHHPKANILAVRAALDALTVARDGVDGRKIGIYGEGWDFGEVAGNARFEQATQANMAGTGVGTFSDRLRDAVRGGGPFDDDPRVQGIGSGLAGDLNGSPANGDVAARLSNYSDLVKLGMAGNMAAYRFQSTAGPVVSGRDVPYNGAPAGYTGAPGEAITYADAHDNETLFDALMYKLPPGTSVADRVRMQQVALAPVLLGQGRPFVHAGTEFLRSKSLDRNSFDSGDWFNPYDPSLRDNGFGRGLPPAADNQSKWPYARPLLGTARPSSSSDMRTSLDGTLELLRIRRSSPLFSLGSLDLVQQKVSFPAAEPGVIVMHVDDTVGPDADPARRGVLVVINPYPTDKQVTLPGDGWRPLTKATRPGESRSVVVLER